MHRETLWKAFHSGRQPVQGKEKGGDWNGVGKETMVEESVEWGKFWQARKSDHGSNRMKGAPESSKGAGCKGDVISSIKH